MFSKILGSLVTLGCTGSTFGIGCSKALQLSWRTQISHLYSDTKQEQTVEETKPQFSRLRLFAAVLHSSLIVSYEQALCSHVGRLQVDWGPRLDTPGLTSNTLFIADDCGLVAALAPSHLCLHADFTSCVLTAAPICMASITLWLTASVSPALKPLDFMNKHVSFTLQDNRVARFLLPQSVNLLHRLEKNIGSKSNIQTKHPNQTINEQTLVWWRTIQGRTILFGGVWWPWSDS